MMNDVESRTIVLPTVAPSGGGAGQKPRLLVTAGPLEGREYVIGKFPYTIGSGLSNDLTIADPTVSRRHCEIVCDARGNLSINDLGSTNGTSIEGVKVSSARLSPNTEVQLGRTRLVVPSVQDRPELTMSAREQFGHSIGRTPLMRHVFLLAEQAAARSKSRAALQNRIFSLVMFLLSALMIAAFLTAYYKPEIHAEYSLYQVDVIGQIKFWVEVGEPLDLFLAIVNIAAAAFAAIGFVVSLLGLITGRYARKTFMVLTFLSAAAYAAEIIYEVVKKVFDAAWDADILTLLALSGLAFLLSVVFAAVCVRREDREETVLHSHSEI